MEHPEDRNRQAEVHREDRNHPEVIRHRVGDRSLRHRAGRQEESQAADRTQVAAHREDPNRREVDPHQEEERQAEVHPGDPNRQEADRHPADTHHHPAPRLTPGFPEYSRGQTARAARARLPASRNYQIASNHGENHGAGWLFA